MPTGKRRWKHWNGKVWVERDAELEAFYSRAGGGVVQIPKAAEVCHALKTERIVITETRSRALCSSLLSLGITSP